MVLCRWNTCTNARVLYFVLLTLPMMQLELLSVATGSVIMTVVAPISELDATIAAAEVQLGRAGMSTRGLYEAGLIRLPHSE